MQTDFPERLRMRGLFTYGVVKVGELCRHQVYDVFLQSVTCVDQIDLYRR